MFHQDSEIVYVLILGTLGFLLFAFVIILFVLRYSKRVVEHQLELSKQAEESQHQMMEAVISAEEKEKSRIAEELHDGLAPDIVGIKNVLYGYNSKILAGEEASQLFTVITDKLSSMAEETRKMAHNLTPLNIEQYGLIKSVEDIVKTINIKGNLKAYLTIDGNYEPKEMNVELGLYRIIQELVQNVQKHSGATEVNITVTTTPEKLILAVQDNGVGFSLDKLKNPGLGIRNLQSRSRFINADIHFSTDFEQGSKVILELKNNLI